jgi:hypothetical protein
MRGLQEAFSSGGDALRICLPLSADFAVPNTGMPGPSEVLFHSYCYSVIFRSSYSWSCFGFRKRGKETYGGTVSFNQKDTVPLNLSFTFFKNHISEIVFECDLMR